MSGIGCCKDGYRRIVAASNPAGAQELQVDKRVWIAAWILAALPLLGFWAYGLFDIDEGYYAAVSAEMVRSNDWIIPRYLGEPWFEKPILIYWLQGLSLLFFGESVGPRVPSILATLGLYGTCAAFIAKRIHSRVGLIALLILATTPLIVAVGRLAITDPLLNVFLFGAVLLFIESFRSGPRLYLLIGLCLGLAVLAKGPVALVLFAAFALWTKFAEPVRFGGFFWILGGLAVFATAVALWYVPAYLSAGELFYDQFVLEQNVGRFFGGDRAHAVPWWSHSFYYPLVLLIGLLPWSVFIWRSWPRRSGEARHADDLSFVKRSLARWAILVILFFTLSGSKLPHYVLPAVPALAMLVAIAWSESILQKSFVGGVRTALITSLVLVAVVNAGFIGYYHWSGQSEAHSLARWLRMQGGTVFLYRIGRMPSGTSNESSRATPLKIQESAMPSLVFLLDGVAKTADSPTQLKPSIGSSWLITRKGRIDQDDLHRLQMRGIHVWKVTGIQPQTQFEIYRIQSIGDIITPDVPDVPNPRAPDGRSLPRTSPKQRLRR